MKIHTKLRRLFATVAERGGTLTSQTALAERMGVTRSQVSQWFGYARDNDPLDQPPARLGQFIAEFRKAGIPIEMHWLSAPLEVFERLLQETTGFDARPALSWEAAVRRFAHAHDGLSLHRPGLRLREEGAPASQPLEPFRIDERVYLTLELPEDLLNGTGEVFATVVHEAWHKTVCLFPPEEAASVGVIVADTLRLPVARERHYLVSGPVGVQRVHAVLSRSRPRSLVHAGLTDIDLHLELDRLTSELAARPAAEWCMLSTAYEVVAAAGAIASASVTGRSADG